MKSASFLCHEKSKRTISQKDVFFYKQGGYTESFNGKLRDECLDGELFLCLAEAKYIVDRWRLDYNHHRPHSMLDWMAPAAFAASCLIKGRTCVPSDSPLRAHPSEHTDENMAPTLTEVGT